MYDDSISLVDKSLSPSIKTYPSSSSLPSSQSNSNSKSWMMNFVLPSNSPPQSTFRFTLKCTGSLITSFSSIVITTTLSSLTNVYLKCLLWEDEHFFWVMHFLINPNLHLIFWFGLIKKYLIVLHNYQKEMEINFNYKLDWKYSIIWMEVQWDMSVKCDISLSSNEIHNLLLTSLLSCSSKGDVDEMTKIISLGPSLLNEVVNVWMVILLR